jgi:MoaA/NifB/PqqE/SkfB family radical SAM enzyme
MKTHHLVLQPYGAAFVDGNNGKVEILNETAAIILTGVANLQSEREIANCIAKNYEITLAEALVDVSEFIQECPHTKKYPIRVSGSNSITSVIQADLELTLDCPLKCDYCFANAGEIDPKENTEDEWRKTIHWLVKNGLKHAIVSGGDPLASRSFWTVCELLSASYIPFQIFTTGLMLNKNFIRRLKSLPLSFIQISLDSIDPKLHDRYRGKSHSKAVEAIINLRENGIYTVIGSNIFFDSIGEVEKLASFASNVGAELRCNPIDARGRGASFLNENAYNSTLSRILEEEIERVKQIYPNVFLADDNETQVQGAKCKFAYGMIAVGSDGRIRPCLESKEFFLSAAPWAIDERKAFEIESLQDHAAFSQIDSIDEYYKPQGNICSSCEKAAFCYGCLLAGYTCDKLNTAKEVKA